MRDKETGKKILALADHTMPDADQLKEQQELVAEAIGDFEGDKPGYEGMLYTQHYLVCADCGKAGGTIHKTGHGDDATYKHLGGCEWNQKPFNRETRRKLGMR